MENGAEDACSELQPASEHVKRYSVSGEAGEMQIQTTVITTLQYTFH